MQFVLGNWWILTTSYRYYPLIWNMIQGVLYLLYPLCGWIAELCSKSFKTIQASFVLIFLGSVASCLGGSLKVSTPLQKPDPELKSFPLYTFLGGINVLMCLVGLGMYESNAIQFGMDQMIEASSEQLSSYIHWYFWCVHLGPIAMYYIMVTYYYFVSNCGQHVTEGTVFGYALYYLGWIVLFTSVIQLILSVVGIISTVYYKRKYHIEQISRNALSTIFKVLQYSYQHKYPERRSAFTYWENDIPSRINLGKEKYGGPFTYEQVEDVKTVFRLLLLMVSVFGFHLSGDGYSFSSYLIKSVGCPTFVPFVMFTVNPFHIQGFIVLVGIPCYQFFLKKYRFVNWFTLLKRIWIGLLLCLVNEALQCFYSTAMQENDFTCSNLNLTSASYQLQCLVANVKTNNGSACTYFCSTPPVSSLIVNLSFIVPLIRGVSFVLVFLSMIEFICAQSPNAMKGVLIGVWYLMLSFKFFVISNLDMYPELLNVNTWSAYDGVKGLGIFVSIVLFSVASRTYNYRKRNETVNEQLIIEEVYERELLLNSDDTEVNLP